VMILPDGRVFVQDIIVTTQAQNGKLDTGAVTNGEPEQRWTTNDNI